MDLTFFDPLSTNSDTLDLAVCMKYNILPIAANTKCAESMKDTSLYKTVNRSELITTCLHNTISQLKQYLSGQSA